MTNSKLIMLDIFMFRFPVLFLYIYYKNTGDMLQWNIASHRTKKQKFTEYPWVVKVSYLPVNPALTASHLVPTPYRHLLSWYLPPKKTNQKRNIGETKKGILFWRKFDSLSPLNIWMVHVQYSKNLFKTKKGRIQSIEITSSTWACVCCNLLFDLKFKETEILSTSNVDKASADYRNCPPNIWKEDLTARDNQDIRQIMIQCIILKKKLSILTFWRIKMS